MQGMKSSKNASTPHAAACSTKMARKAKAGGHADGSAYRGVDPKGARFLQHGLLSYLHTDVAPMEQRALCGHSRSHPIRARRKTR